MTPTVNLLTFTSLYPSSVRPRHGVFVESRLQRLVRRGGLSAAVIAPVPWFPFKGSRWGEYGRVARTPGREERGGIDVRYPRYPSVPHLGFAMKPALMARAGLRAVEQLLRAGGAIDLVDGHYLYPDGVAAAEIAKRLGRPYVLSARGTDVNVLARMPEIQVRIRRAIDESAGVITVSCALKEALVGMGVPAERISVLRNGVDPSVFYPADRVAARRELGLPANAPLVLCVGNLVEEKRPDLALEAAMRVPEAHIAFVGRGTERTRLERLAGKARAGTRVTFLEELPQSKLRIAYSAADVLVLASEREGWPNVLLESAACGTPVIAFRVGGVPEMLGDPAMGLMVDGPHDPSNLAKAIGTLLAMPQARALVRTAAMAFDWDPVLEAQLNLYRRAAALTRDAAAGKEMAVA
jgi:teichuronic acid biosynthesis glycosyltransferase TuaC